MNKLLEWSLVEEKKECSGDEISNGRMLTPGECASACNGVASMFAFGTNDFGVPRCDSNGCQCLCETAAADDGTCNSVQHKGYRLYRLRAVGKLFLQNTSYFLEIYLTSMFSIISCYIY